jgi:hypothetical protein
MTTHTTMTTTPPSPPPFPFLGCVCVCRNFFLGRLKIWPLEVDEENDFFSESAQIFKWSFSGWISSLNKSLDRRNQRDWNFWVKLSTQTHFFNWRRSFDCNSLTKWFWLRPPIPSPFHRRPHHLRRSSIRGVWCKLFLLSKSSWRFLRFSC